MISATYSKIARRIRVPLGFVLAALYIWLARPSWKSLLVGIAIATPGLALRAVAAGTVKKNRELATTGPYAFTRNPLYLGSILIGIGFGVASRNGWIAVAIVVMFLAIYLPVIRAEEEYLRSQFSGFDEYARMVPRLWPRFTAGKTAAEPVNSEESAGQSGFSRHLYWKHREYNALLGAVGMMAVLIVKILYRH